jgi:hypothetical protein
VKKCLLWFAAAMLLTMISVPPVMADGNPDGGPPPKGVIVNHPSLPN